MIWFVTLRVVKKEKKEVRQNIKILRWTFSPHFSKKKILRIFHSFPNESIEIFCSLTIVVTLICFQLVHFTSHPHSKSVDKNMWSIFAEKSWHWKTEILDKTQRSEVLHSINYNYVLYISLFRLTIGKNNGQDMRKSGWHVQIEFSE